MSARKPYPDCVYLDEVWTVGVYPGKWVWTYYVTVDNSFLTPQVISGSTFAQRTWTKKAAALRAATKMADALGLKVLVPDV
jgi:hypothetical protein